MDGDSYNSKIAELPAGGTSFSDVALSEPIGPIHLQWWNKRLVVYAGAHGVHAPYQIFQVRISGSNGIVTGPVLLYGKNKHRPGTAVEFAVSGGTLVMPDGPGHSLLNLWHYPKGGRPYKVFDSRPRSDFYGVAISQ